MTEWEAKERAGLLAIETEERRDQRRIAEDPDTPAEVLNRLARQALDDRTPDRFAWFRHLDSLREQAEANPATRAEPLPWKRAPWRRSELLFQALAAHPNTPPGILVELIGTAPLIPQVTSAFFRNRATPALLLEQSGILDELDVFCQLLLLREADALPLFVQQVADSKDMGQEGAAREAAKMHVATAGEIRDARTGEAEMKLQKYWGTITPYSRTFLWQTPLLPEKAESPRWTDRLEAISRAEATNAPTAGDFYNRSGLDLLHYLTRDGNRFVRWTAQTRLATAGVDGDLQRSKQTE